MLHTLLKYIVYVHANIKHMTMLYILTIAVSTCAGCIATCMQRTYFTDVTGVSENFYADGPSIWN